MGEYLSPGVYVEEMPGSQPVQPAGTSTAAFVGFAEKGPIKEPVFVTNYAEYEATFGGVCAYKLADDTEKQGYLPYAVRSFFDNGGGRCYIVRVASDQASFAKLVANYQIDSNMPSSITESKFKINTVGPGPNFTETHVTDLVIKPASEGNWASNFRVEIGHTTTNEKLGTSGTSSTTFKISVIKAGEFADEKGNAINDIVVEEFDDLTLDATSKDYFVNRINEKSNYIEITDADVTVKDATTPTRPTKAHVIEHAVLRFAHAQTEANGSVGHTGLSDIEAPHFTGTGMGVHALEIIDELNILAVPDAHNLASEDDIHAVLGDAQTYALNRADCMFVAESMLDEDDPVKGSRKWLASKSTAYYTPWITVLDRVTGTKKNIPPCGAVAGIYARTDKNRGVFKAPAGTMDGGVNGIIGLEKPINKAKQGLLNPIGINCIREMPNVGNVIWGARTTSPDAQWRYIPVRRLILFIEKSLEKAAQSSVFEPNDQKLWSRIKRDFSGFLRGIWKEGGLFGATEDQAFFVKVDEENNPQSSRDAGKLIINIGVAPVKPAEFVIIRIEQTQNA